MGGERNFHTWENEACESDVGGFKASRSDVTALQLKPV